MTKINSAQNIRHNNQNGLYGYDNNQITDLDKKSVSERLKNLQDKIKRNKEYTLADDDSLRNGGGGFPIIITGGA